MPPGLQALQRHQLALLTEAGWRSVLDGSWDAQARDCLAHWAQHCLPLVVTRQQPQGSDTVCLGLPAPGRWGRRRIALAVARHGIARCATFPVASRLLPLLAADRRAPWRRLCEALSACSTAVHVYGSHGWQLLTGLDHLRPGSDIDLCIHVRSPAQADAACALLQQWPADAPRLDGEVVFDDGSAVAWREWCAWRAGRTPSMLVKRLAGVALVQGLFWTAAEVA